jgi:hypothetical protein
MLTDPVRESCDQNHSTARQVLAGRARFHGTQIADGVSHPRKGGPATDTRNTRSLFNSAPGHPKVLPALRVLVSTTGAVQVMELLVVGHIPTSELHGTWPQITSHSPAS